MQTNQQLKEHPDLVSGYLLIYLDLSPRAKKYWFMCVDDYSRKKWSRFRKTKNEIGGPLEELLILMKGRGTPVQYIRCDNAGENEKYVKALCDKYGIQT